MAEAGRALAGRYRRKRRIAAGGIADGSFRHLRLRSHRSPTNPMGACL
jgi:hypothetical protein